MMKWKQTRSGKWALGPIRIEQRGDRYAVYAAQLELPLGQKPPEPGVFKTLGMAKDWGRLQVQGYL